jgi:cytochrome c oxidase subunit II
MNPQATIVAGYEPIMPTFQGLVTEEQLLQLIAYIKSIGPRGEPTGTASPGAPAGEPAQGTPEGSIE